MARFRYTPLDENVGEIRLVTLIPGPFSADIQVFIHHAKLKLQNTPVYEALSYVWGSINNPVDIKVGFEGEEILSITQNLATALQYLRYEDKPRVLWIDAICIDQQNVKERGHQVGFMGKIYKLADRVVVWLGPEGDDSTYALELIDSLASKVEVDWVTWDLKPSYLGEDEPDWADESKYLPYEARELCALNHLIHRSWFERLWIQQEIHLAKPGAIVMCGFTTISWEAIRIANSCLYIKQNLIKYIGVEKGPFINRLNIILELSRDHSIYRFMYLLRQTNCSNCSDPRDRIYAMLGLRRESERNIDIRPDYTQTISQVYQNLVIQFIDCYKRLDVLNCCEMQDKPGALPTWVPDWSKGVLAEILEGVAADAFSPAVAQYMGDGVLKAAGIYSATIQSIEECDISAVPKYSQSPEVIPWIRKCAPDDVFTASYFGGGSMLDAYCRTLCMNMFSENWIPTPSGFPSSGSSKDFLAAVLKLDGSDIPDINPGSPDAWYVNVVSNFVRYRSFFTTKEGYIGLAPKAAKPGDEVCILLGCSSPLVLRKTGNMQYQVVGESFLYGIMYGEALLGPLPAHYRTVNCYIESLGTDEFRFLNTRTGEIQELDPRLEKLTKDECVQSGQIGNVDFSKSLLTPQRLRELGLNVTDFELI
jgi:hypothetical protein